MKDKCIICNKETLFDETDHIDNRYGYVEGAGQLCIDCYSSTTSEQGFTPNVISLTPEMVLNTPNDMELGSLVRKMMYEKQIGV